MSKKITNFFKKNCIPLTFVFLFLLFLLPEIADGFNLAGNITGPVKMKLAGLAETFSAWFVIYVIVFVFFILGVAALFLSTTLLQGAIDNSVESLNILQGESAFVVHAGWNFMAGITNMMLLIGFIIIAIAIIMGSDSYGLKKAMPQLILVAFLVNFTLLFVGMGVDITNTIYNTIASQFSQEDGGNMLWEAITPLLNLGTRTIAGTVAFLIGIGIVKATGIGAIGVFYLFGIGFIAFLPFIIQFIIIGAIMFLLSGVFLTFYAVFIMRNLIISILAIISPLAFFCLIFPSTRKYFTMWVEHLTQWLLVGITFIFLMYIALALAPFAMEIGQETETAVPFFLRWWTGSIVPYIILLLYFVAILGISKSLIPKLASMAIDQGKNAVGVVAPYIQTAGGLVSRNLQKARSESIIDKRSRDPEGFDKGLNDAITDPITGSIFQKSLQWAKRQHATSQKSAIDYQKAEGRDKIDKMKDLDNTSVEGRIKQAKADKNYKDLATAVLGADKHGKDGGKIKEEISSITREDYKKMRSEAEKFGEEKKLDKAMPIHSIGANSEGKTVDEKKNIIDNFVAKSSKDDISKIAEQLIEASKKGDAIANEILKAITEGNRDQITAIIQKGGQKGYDALRKQHGTADPKIPDSPAIEYLLKVSDRIGRYLMSDADKDAVRQAKKKKP